MAKKDIEQNHLRVSQIPPSPETGIKIEDDVLILLSQAFCPKGHNLIGIGEHSFDGFPGIAVLISDEQKEGIVELSPFHGDASKIGISFETGARVSLRCPVCKTEFPVSAKCGCSGNGALRKLYLTTSLDEAHVVNICDVWGCRRSRTVDSFEVLSEYIEGNISGLDE